MRAELLSLEQVKRLAKELAQQYTVAVVSGPDRLLPRLADNTRALRESHQVVVDALAQERRLSPPAEWLLDNFYRIEQQIQLARQHMPPKYSRRLPRLTGGPLKGFPRVYAMASELISHLDGLLDGETTTAFVAAYQTVAPLRLGELWAFPIALRLGLIENLRRVAVRIARHRQERDAGIAWAERTLATADRDPKHLVGLLSDFTDAQPTLTAPFLEEFVGRLQGHGANEAFMLNWVEHALAEQSTTVAQLLHADSHAQAAEHLSIANSIGSLRFLDAMDWKTFVETLSHVEHVLRLDPAGNYAAQDFATRDRYRHVVEGLAQRAQRSEVDVAQTAVDLALAAPAVRSGPNRGRHVGTYLVGKGRRPLERAIGCPWSLGRTCGRLVVRCRLGSYLGAVLLATVSSAALLPWSHGISVGDVRFWLLMAAALLPASALAISLVHLLVTLHVPPHPPPSLDFSKGIPAGHRTMVVIPTLLQEGAELSRMLEALEIRYLGNRDPQLHFALLTDFPDANRETLPGDAEALRRAQEGIADLNARHPRRGEAGTTFYLFHRARQWNAHERVWMAYERKRGKLEQFNALLRGAPPTAFQKIVGDLAVLPSVQYVITLDADTELPRGAAHRMVGAMAHILNRPSYDPARGRVVEGYGILQPRACVGLAAAERSRFSRLTSGDARLDPYTREVSDVYQDLFGEGSYVGKGIYDVDAFRHAVEGRFPDNVILSHDLLESGYARSALLSGVEVYEDAPSSYLGEISRQHRWMRGDWQIARWVFGRPPSGTRPRDRNPLSLLTRWKIVDNLRRGLFAPALFLALVVGWTFGPLPGHVWTLFAIASLLLTGVLRTLTQLVSKPGDRGWRLHLRTWWGTIPRPFAQPMLSLACLPYEAVVCVDAFLCSAARLPFTRRGLLVWHLPQYARRNARRSLAGFFAEMWPAAALAAATAALVAVRRPASAAAALPVLALWMLAPAVAWWISRPRRPTAPALTPVQWRLLRMLSCRTWRFFDTYTGPNDHWLPPDNFQEVPKPVVASRTSPTNMGFALLANLSAWDFGYISTARLLERTRHTLDAMESLERYRGQFYNWYDTQSMLPLHPLYVSSVDSGNLAACLLALRVGLEALQGSPALPPQLWQGLRSTLEVLADELGAAASPELRRRVRDLDLALATPPTAPREALACLEDVRAAAALLTAAVQGELAGEAATWARFFEAQCRDHSDSANALLRPADGRFFTLAELAGRSRVDAPPVRTEAVGHCVALQRSAERCLALETAMDFQFLYDEPRKLLRVGYDAEARRLDPACYDLLASESRITSFLLIAGEHVAPEHWFALGRLLTGQERASALVSWSGSMFEYLMPALFMTHAEGTLLERTCRAIIGRQVRYGRQRHIPWGISESCYNATDTHHVYQYRAFGVPGLGLKRGLAEDLVVAPYATLLALPFAPVQACENLERLVAHEEALGPYGLFEAIDYTPARVPRGRTRVVIRSYMSHHQGMGLLALSQILLDGPMVRRFMSEPTVRATELLLQERMPDVAPVVQPHEREASADTSPAVEPATQMRVFATPNTPAPEVQLLSNGNYHVMVTNSGGGYSRWRELAITRWREDATCDDWGSFVYLRDVDTASVWSAAFHPTRRAEDAGEAIFTPGRAEFRRRDREVDSHTEICVSPEDDVEIRRVTLTNPLRRRRRLEITSYAEVVLAPLAADLAHRVFSNLFVHTEIHAERNAILCSRRKRSDSDPDAWMFHLLLLQGSSERPSFETDRARFLGRGRTPANPVALQSPAGKTVPLSNHEGHVLDPVVAIRMPLELLPDRPVVAHLITGAAETRAAALALVDKYRDHHFVGRAFDMAWSHSQLVRRLLNASETETQTYGRLAGSMIFAHARLRAAPAVIARNQLGPQGLWRFGISGDLPILLLRIGDLRRVALVGEALRAHAYWNLKGLRTDLVILNEDFSGYRAALNDAILAAIAASTEGGLLDKPGGIFVRRVDNLSEEDRVLFQSVARVVLTDTAETLREQVERRHVPKRLPPPLGPSLAARSEPPPPLTARERILGNGLGGFTPDGREYVITLEPGQTTPAPWANVIASPHAGTVVSESGGMYTWTENAHEFRLTPWHNDPVSDGSGEAFYLRDEETGRIWSPSPLPTPGRAGYVCRHGFGYSVFEHDDDGIRSEMWVYVAMDAPVKFVAVKLRNHSGRARRLSLTAYFELVLGEWRHSNLMHVQTEVDPETGALFARNPYSREFHDRVVFAACSEPALSVSGSRTEFLGRNGSTANPAALGRTRLSGRTGAGLDPAAVLQAGVELGDGEEREVVFTLGAARDAETAGRWVQRFAGHAGAHAALEEVWAYWNHLLGAVHIEAPAEAAFAVLTNGWLVYQTLSCRLWGRSGYYQSGGAYGFRDQLQDAMALIHADAGILRAQLLLCASRQFREGDVQHWWHPPAGAGVRTHISDDLLWLPQAAAHYVQTTGDTGVLDEIVPFLDGRPLADEEESQYDQHPTSSETGSLYEHCVRALRRSLRFGAHGLPLIGGGDWNDGMNRIGQDGQGESVWLAWFLCDALRRFADVARGRRDGEFASACLQEYATLRERIEEAAWDGEWYRRAYFDDGTPVGSAQNDECRIDSISQSWAVLSRAAQPERARQAMESVRERLVRPEDQLLLLFDPPFDRTALDPGYIKGYPPGVRENGGQYTHAAIWSVMAFAELGEHGLAWDLFRMLNPIAHGDSPHAMQRYQIEPYVMAADLYGKPPHTGRGGWSWYTGSAGWMYRLAVETLLGLERRPDHLRISPRLPPGPWSALRIHYRFQETFYHIEVQKSSSPADVRVALDGVDQPEGRIPLQNDRRDHQVAVLCGSHPELE